MDRYTPPQVKLGDLTRIPMRGGMITVRERPSLEFGEKSLVQNMRCWHPAFETRPGYSLLNSSTYSDSSTPFAIYQYVSGEEFEGSKRTELFLAMSDRLLTSAITPPSTGTTLASKTLTTSTPSIVPSFSNLDDYLLYSDGTDQHKMIAGRHRKISGFHEVVDSAAHDFFPRYGIDATASVFENNTDLYFDGQTISTLAAHDAWYICTMTPAYAFTFRVKKANSISGVLRVDFWDYDNLTWTSTSVSDGTSSGGKTMAQDGEVTLGDPTTSARFCNTGVNEIPRLMFGVFGYWYRFSCSSGGMSQHEISHIAYSDITSSGTYPASMISVQNLWNGVETDIIEVLHYDDSEANYFNYAGDSIDISNFEGAGPDYLYFSSPYKLMGVYVDFGGTSNTTGADPTITEWDGDSWSSLTQWYDGTEEFTKSGWITWKYWNCVKHQFDNTRYNAYWYRIALDATVDDNVVIALWGMPTFDINEIGSVGRVNHSWKDRAVYTFNNFPRDLYISQKNAPNVLNGTEYGILQPGDGRKNATVAIADFYNEIMVFQEELGKEGGCTTIFEGYSPETWGKLILSTKVGTFHQGTVAVVDGAKSTQTNKDLNAQTQVYFLSHYGVYMSDGKTVSAVSDDIQNYFDERFSSDCIRKGYENEMWLSYDSTEHMIKIGLVTGSSATRCNKWFCYDLVDGVWYEDVYATDVTRFTEVEAGSGALYTLQLAFAPSAALGNNWYLCRMNNGTSDLGTAIDAKITWEFKNGPWFIGIEEIMTTVKVQGAATAYTWSVEEYDVETDTGTGSMVAKNANETMRRNRHLMKTGSMAWSSFTIRNNTLDEKIYLYDMGIIARSTEHK